jgi:hypothetical protein
VSLLVFCVVVLCVFPWFCVVLLCVFTCFLCCPIVCLYLFLCCPIVCLYLFFVLSYCVSLLVFCVVVLCVICVGHHYTQTNTNNVNKTWALLQTTRGQDEPNIVLVVFMVFCTLCCQFLWTVHCWLPHRFSQTFI